MAAVASPFIGQSYLSTVRSGNFRADVDANATPAARANTIMYRNLRYRNDMVNEEQSDPARNYAAVSVQYQDNAGIAQRQDFWAYSYGDRTDGKNHGEQRAWNKAKRWIDPRMQYGAIKEIATIDIASDRAPCIDSSYSNLCSVFFAPGGGATVGKANSLIFKPSRDQFVHAGRGSDEELLADVKQANEWLSTHGVNIPEDETPQKAPNLNENDFPPLGSVAAAASTGVIPPVQRGDDKKMAENKDVSAASAATSSGPAITFAYKRSRLNPNAKPFVPNKPPSKPVTPKPT